MILRFKLFTLAGATAFLSTPSDAFIPASISSGTRVTTTARPSSLRPDWDNDDFLSSLDKGQEKIEEANDKYYKQAENRAELDAWRAKEALKNASPEFLKKMGLDVDGNDIEQKPAPSTMAQQQAQVVQPPPAQTGGAPPAQQLFDANGNPVAAPMVYDANGNLVPFNPATQQQPAAVAQTMPPQINPRPVFDAPLSAKTKGTDTPRPEGFNTDAYTMSNTADVYLAQLKQDTKIRKIARMSGDLETANTVFGDDTVKQIGDSWVDNPYTKEKNRAEARAEIEGTVRMQVSGNDAPEISSGISYKEKLEQMKSKRAGGGTIGQQVAAPAPPKVVEEPPKVVEQPTVAVSAPPKVVEQPIPIDVVAPPAAVTPPPAAPGPVDESDIRGKVRTLQGLLLKHRGGPGFGAGRLKAPEAKRLEDTLEDVKRGLRAEVGGESKPAALVAQPVAAAPSAPVAEAKPAAVQQPIAAAPVPVQAAPVVPAPVQATPVVSVASPTPLADPLAGSVACVEAVLNMYKASSPIEKEMFMIPLKEALIAASNACDKAIAEKATNASPAAIAPGTVIKEPEPAMGFPTTYAVTKPDEEVSTAQPTSTSNDPAENVRQLEGVYKALTEARGTDGKLGLKNLSGDEANALKEEVITMRVVLMDELKGGK